MRNKNKGEILHHRTIAKFHKGTIACDALNALADKKSQLCCVNKYRQPLVGTGSADDTKTLAEAMKVLLPAVGNERILELKNIMQADFFLQRFNNNKMR